MSISTYLPFDFSVTIDDEINRWLKDHNEPPEVVYISIALYHSMKQRYQDPSNINGAFRMEFIHGCGTVRVQPTILIDNTDKSIHVLAGTETSDLENYIINRIIERELLCDTTGASTVDTATTTEKTKREE